MIFGRYKKTYIFLSRDDVTKQWFAVNLKATDEDKKYSEFYDTVDKLRDALRLNTANWFSLREHIQMLIKARKVA